MLKKLQKSLNWAKKFFLDASSTQKLVEIHNRWIQFKHDKIREKNDEEKTLQKQKHPKNYKNNINLYLYHVCDSYQHLGPVSCFRVQFKQKNIFGNHYKNVNKADLNYQAIAPTCVMGRSNWMYVFNSSSI